MNTDSLYHKAFTKSFLLLLQGLLIIFLLYIVLGSLNGIMIGRYERNSFEIAIDATSNTSNDTRPQNGRVAGAETSREGIEDGYIVDPSVLLIP